jgi:hypothetical protein
MNWAKAEIYWRLFFDVTIGILLVVNFVNGFRLRRRYLEVQRFSRDKAPMLVNALESMAAAACPLCAIATGKVTHSEAGDPPFLVEAENDGGHVLHGQGGDSSAVCLAASIHKDIRSLITESISESKNLKGAAQ